LLEMLQDKFNFLYIVFLQPLVHDFEESNAFFQAAKSDPETMVKELNLLPKSLKDRIKNIRRDNLVLSLVDFGTTFTSEA